MPVAVAAWVLTAVVFAASAFAKLSGRIAWRGYVRSLRDSRVVPRGLTGTVAYSLVVTEVTCVVLTVVPVTRRWGTALAAALALTLTVGVVLAVLRGSGAACHCFGAGDRLSWSHVVRNAVLFVVAASGAASAWLTGDPGSVPALALAAVAGVAAACCVVRWEDVVWALGGLRHVRAGRT